MLSFITSIWKPSPAGTLRFPTNLSTLPKEAETTGPSIVAGQQENVTALQTEGASTPSSLFEAGSSKMASLPGGGSPLRQPLVKKMPTTLPNDLAATDSSPRSRPYAIGPRSQTNFVRAPSFCTRTHIASRKWQRVVPLNDQAGRHN